MPIAKAGKWLGAWNLSTGRMVENVTAGIGASNWLLTKTFGATGAVEALLGTGQLATVAYTFIGLAGLAVLGRATNLY